MYEEEPKHSQGLVARYSFEPEKLVRDEDRQVGSPEGHLSLPARCNPPWSGSPEAASRKRYRCRQATAPASLACL
jgi:hypothetical protein